MKAIHITIICVLVVTCRGMAYDPPERFWYRAVPSPEMSEWAQEFIWLGDQNDDGCDELLVTNGRFSSNYTHNDWGRIPNRVELYYGGREMDTIPDVFFGPYLDYEGMGYSLCFLGNLTGNGPFDFAIKSMTWEDNVMGSTEGRIYIYQGGMEFDTIPDFTISMWRDVYEGGKLILYRLERPCDINGDGYNDLIFKRWIRAHNELPDIQICFGGEDFDTIPDLALKKEEANGTFANLDIQSGFDLNGDGCDEILIHSSNSRERMIYWSLFLGGEEMDSVALFEFEREYDPEELGLNISNISMISDINEDGYDDWGIHYFNTRRGEETTWIFFGGDSLQMDEPDRILQPYGYHAGGGGRLLGGDLNNDGVGDAINSSGSPGSYGNVRIFFGSPWMDEEVDIEITGMDELPDGIRMLQGAYSDFNNDGINDFVVYANHVYSPPSISIFSGNEDWVVSVEKEAVIPEIFDLSIDSFPNPFNSSVTITYETVQSSFVRLAVYDIRGRLVEELENRRIIKGHHRLTWENRTSGIYFILLETGSTRVVKKIVCVP